MHPVPECIQTNRVFAIVFCGGTHRSMLSIASPENRHKLSLRTVVSINGPSVVLVRRMSPLIIGPKGTLQAQVGSLNRRSLNTRG